MMKWHFPADNDAIHTVVGEKTAGLIRLQSRPGCGLFGPYVNLPGGTCTARVMLDGLHEGHITMDIAAECGQMVLASRLIDLGQVEGQMLELSAVLPGPLSGCEIRLHSENDARVDISSVQIDLVSSEPSALDPGRPVGTESRKSYAEKIVNGFFAKYLSGEAILEIGYKGYIDGTVPIVPQAIGIDLDYPGYDGVRLPFPDESQDAVYSSHCLEHIQEYQDVLREWYRVLKIGGYLIVIVPHQHLFERRRELPSRWGGSITSDSTRRGVCCARLRKFFPPTPIVSAI
jgi:SAM-dependent methyltransferase